MTKICLKFSPGLGRSSDTQDGPINGDCEKLQQNNLGMLGNNEHIFIQTQKIKSKSTLPCGFPNIDNTKR